MLELHIYSRNTLESIREKKRKVLQKMNSQVSEEPDRAINQCVAAERAEDIRWRRVMALCAAVDLCSKNGA